VSDTYTEIDDLLQAALDSALPNDERERLAQLIEKDPSLHAEFSAYQQLNEQLNELPEQEPSAESLQATLSAIKAIQANRKQMAARRAWWLDWLEGPPLRYGMAFLLGAGITTGILGTVDMKPDSVNPVELSGMMAPPETRLITLHEQGLQGRVEVVEADGQIQLQLQLNAVQATQLAVIYNPKGYRFSGLSEPFGEWFTLSSSTGKLALEVSGEQRITLVFDALSTGEQIMELRYTENSGAVKRINIISAGEV